MFQNLPLPAAQEFSDSSSGVTLYSIMKNDGVLSFSPERWTKVVLQERTVVGSVYRLPWYIVQRGAVLPHQCHTPQRISSSQHIVQGALCLDEENRDASIHLIDTASLVRMSEPRFHS